MDALDEEFFVNVKEFKHEFKKGKDYKKDSSIVLKDMDFQSPFIDLSVPDIPKKKVSINKISINSIKKPIQSKIPIDKKKDNKCKGKRKKPTELKSSINKDKVDNGFNINTIMGSTLLARAPIDLFKDTDWSITNVDESSSLDKKLEKERQEIHYYDVIQHDLLPCFSSLYYDILSPEKMILSVQLLPSFKNKK